MVASSSQLPDWVINNPVLQGTRNNVALLLQHRKLRKPSATGSSRPKLTKLTGQKLFLHSGGGGSSSSFGTGALDNLFSELPLNNTHVLSCNEKSLTGLNHYSAIVSAIECTSPIEPKTSTVCCPMEELAVAVRVW